MHFKEIAIFFNLFQEDYYCKTAIDLFFHKIRFPFFLIWRNEELQNVKQNMVITLVNYLKQYMKSDYYIKIKEKPILSINNPNIIMDIKNILYIFRKEAKKEIGEIFILYPFTGNFNNKNIFVEFDAIYDFSQIDLLEDHPENKLSGQKATGI